jgi:hypothetical protein
LKETSLPNVPHLQKNPVLAYLLAHDRVDEYQYIRDYMTYDFETMTAPINKEYGKKCVCNGILSPLLVTWTIKNNKKVDSKSKFNTNSPNEFINDWLNMFEDAEEIYKSQNSYYESLNLPEIVTKRLSKDENNKFGISVKVLGFNSKNLDVNFFINLSSNSFFFN